MRVSRLCLVGNLGTYGGVSIVTLVSGEFLEALGFVTDGASEFNGLAADTIPASSMATARERLCTLSDYCVAEHIDLPLGKGALHADLLADGTLDSRGVSHGVLAWNLTTHLSGITTLSSLVESCQSLVNSPERKH